MGADIVVKAVMIGLAFASLLTWTICVAKLLELRSETSRAKRRIEVLGNDISLADAERDARDGKDPVSLLVQSAATEAALSDTVNDEGFKERVELREPWHNRPESSEPAAGAEARGTQPNDEDDRNSTGPET